MSLETATEGDSTDLVLGSDKVVDNVGPAGVAAAVAEPPFANVTVDQGGRVVDAAVAAGSPSDGLEAATANVVVIVLELELPAATLPVLPLLLDGELGDVLLQLGLARQRVVELVVLPLAVHPNIPDTTFLIL